MGLFADPEVDRRFRLGQWRMLATTILGYTLFYFLRKNLSLAMPGLVQDYGVTKASLGLFLTLHGVVYGLGKFVVGPVSDKSRPRIFLMGGLFLAMLANVAFGFGPVFAALLAGDGAGPAFTSVLVTILGLVWVANGFLQASGNPPCLKLIAHWIPPGELATKLAIWNSSHSIGAGLVTILCGYVMGLGALGADGVGVGMWRWCFFAPAIVCALGLVVLWFTLPGTPSEEHLPDLPGTDTVSPKMDDSISDDGAPSALKMVYLNPTIWIVGLCCFMVYVTRFAILDWGPMLLKESKGVSLAGAGWTVACFEIAGILGTLFSGWATDRLAGGRAPRVCLFMMLGAGACMTAFWFLPKDMPTVLSVLALAGAGFCVYGPQAMTGVTAVNLATKRFAGTAVGFTSLFSYGSVILSGWGMGLLSDLTGGWAVPFYVVLACTALGAVFFLCLWNTKPNGYGGER